MVSHPTVSLGCSLLSYLLFSLALDLFGDFRYGVAAVALTGTYKAGEVPTVPIAEALHQAGDVTPVGDGGGVGGRCGGGNGGGDGLGGGVEGGQGGEVTPVPVAEALSMAPV